VGREPVEESPMLPSRVEEGPNRGHLIDLDRALRAVFLQYGGAINDDVITISDFVRSVSAAYTMYDTDRNLLVDATAAPVTITLPAASDAEPHVFRVKKIDAGGNAVTVQRAGADTIDGAASKALSAQYELIALISDRSSAWQILHLGAP